MSKIKANSVVGITYVLTNSQGEELDRAEKAEPLQYIHGMSQIVPGLEKELEGLEVGVTKKVTVTPEEGYGEVNPDLKMTLTRKQFPKDAQIDAGMQFYASTGGERLLLTVTGINGEDIEVDGNHPLSGQTLNFDVEIISIRDATEEEMQHGHVHGPGGHEH
jgi:FKBP-type peptidyl-prolyl cis-trans isomerase SlyD